jgi:NADPH:quinone reductase-like Zn-dependent oxidoreductase
VRVTAVSLNRGEVKRATTIMESGARPGWDFVGVVEQAAAQGGGPEVGARVVGLLSAGAWAERIRAPINAVAVLPDGVTDAQAATLPVAGLTALHGLRRGGLLLGRKVLVDGASGGVGHLAVQLAAASGALVYAHIRREDLRATVAPWCTGGIIVGPSLEQARPSGPFHLILDSVGGAALGAALTMLHRGGVCVTFGVSEAPAATFDSAAFFRTGGATLYGLFVFDEVARGESASDGLALLAALVERKVLLPSVAIEEPWTKIADVARQLMERTFAGKAVLRVRD